MKNHHWLMVVLLAISLGQAGCNSLAVGTLSAFSMVNFTQIYGKVIDQHGEPVDGVEVIVTTSYLKGYAQGFNHYHLTTDKNGRFSVLANGGGPRFDIHKDGYAYDPRVIARQNGDDKSTVVQNSPEHPYVFAIWKLQGIAPWIVLDKHYILKAANGVYTLDLIRGVMADGDAGGDLRLSIKKSPPAASNGSSDWLLAMNAMDGGLVACPEGVFHYEAPEAGYSPGLDFNLGSSPDRFQPTDCGFYITSRHGGVYGRFYLEINFKKTGVIDVKIESMVNPAGSRNLEYTTGKKDHPGPTDVFW